MANEGTGRAERAPWRGGRSLAIALAAAALLAACSSTDTTVKTGGMVEFTVGTTVNGGRARH